MSRIHSERARKNTRDGILLRIGAVEANIKKIKAEIVLYKRYAHSAFAKRVLRHLVSSKLPRRQSQLARYKRRYARLKKEGKI